MDSSSAFEALESLEGKLNRRLHRVMRVVNVLYVLVFTCLKSLFKPGGATKMTKIPLVLSMEFQKVSLKKVNKLLCMVKRRVQLAHWWDHARRMKL